MDVLHTAGDRVDYTCTLGLLQEDWCVFYIQFLGLFCTTSIFIKDYCVFIWSNVLIYELLIFFIYLFIVILSVTNFYTLCIHICVCFYKSCTVTVYIVFKSFLFSTWCQQVVPSRIACVILISSYSSITMTLSYNKSEDTPPPSYNSYRALWFI